ncbi:hypothetical protein [Sodalis sp. (in: enterobacteria)]
MPCTAWADQKWSTIPRSYLARPISADGNKQIHQRPLVTITFFYHNY